MLFIINVAHSHPEGAMQKTIIIMELQEVSSRLAVKGSTNSLLRVESLSHHAYKQETQLVT